MAEGAALESLHDQEARIAVLDVVVQGDDMGCSSDASTRLGQEAVLTPASTAVNCLIATRRPTRRCSPAPDHPKPPRPSSSPMMYALQRLGQAIAFIGHGSPCSLGAPSSAPGYACRFLLALDADLAAHLGFQPAHPTICQTQPRCHCARPDAATKCGHLGRGDRLQEVFWGAVAPIGNDASRKGEAQLIVRERVGMQSQRERTIVTAAELRPPPQLAPAHGLPGAASGPMTPSPANRKANCSERRSHTCNSR